jgi:hypothetical protein
MIHYIQINTSLHTKWFFLSLLVSFSGEMTDDKCTAADVLADGASRCFVAMHEPVVQKTAAMMIHIPAKF